MAKADSAVAKACEAAGIPASFRPSLSLRWYDRGENMFKARRQELRLVAQTRVATIAKQARAEIEARMVEGLTLLVQDSLEIDAAQAFLAAMPTVEELMPSLDVRQLEKLTGKPEPQYPRLADTNAA